MKNKFNYLIIGIMCAIFVSCSKSEPEPSVEYPPEPFPEAQIAIVNVSSEMKNHIFMSPVVDSIKSDNAGKYYTLFYDTLLALSNTQAKQPAISYAEKQLGIIGSNPYIMLDNSYAIIDWKWAMFHPLSGEYISTRYWDAFAGDAYSTNPEYSPFITNEKYYLLGLTWGDLTELNTTWKLSEGTSVEKTQVLFVDLKKIEEYGNSQMSRAILRDKYSTTDISVRESYRLFSKDKNTASEYVKSCDELQDFYVSTLKEMIKNGDLLK